MTRVVTSEFELQRIEPPALPQATEQYSKGYQDQLNNVLRLYFNRLQSILRQLNASGDFDGSGAQLPNGAFHQDGHTTLTANIANGSTTPIPVVSTAGFLPSGGLIIQNEIILYTGTTSTTFTGITRGALGTSSSAHVSGTQLAEAQVVSSTTTPLAVALTVTDTSNGVSIDPAHASRVVFDIAGYYNIQFSTQLLNYTTAEDDVTMWFRKNGVDIDNSAGIVTVPPKHGSHPGSMITSWNLIVDVTAGQYIELMMTNDLGHAVAATFPPGIAPGAVHPASPSVILTATFASALY